MWSLYDARHAVVLLCRPSTVQVNDPVILLLQVALSYVGHEVICNFTTI